MTTKKVKLQSSDGELFEVEIDVIKLSNTIKTILESLGVEEEGEGETIPLPAVNAAILKKARPQDLFEVIVWCQYQKSYPPPMDEDDNKEKRADDISLWDNEFWNVDPDTFFDLILAAVVLDIPDLISVLRKHFCEQFRRKEAQSDHGRSACCSCDLESINEHLSTHKMPPNTVCRKQSDAMG